MAVTDTTIETIKYKVINDKKYYLGISNDITGDGGGDFVRWSINPSDYPNEFNRNYHFYLLYACMWCSTITLDAGAVNPICSQLTGNFGSNFPDSIFPNQTNLIPVPSYLCTYNSGVADMLISELDLRTKPLYLGRPYYYLYFAHGSNDVDHYYFQLHFKAISP